MWSIPADIGGYKITHYKVGHNEGADKPQNLPVPLPSSVTSHMISTLQAGTMCTFDVSAVNVLDSGKSGSANVIAPSRMCMLSLCDVMSSCRPRGCCEYCCSKPVKIFTPTWVHGT